MYSATNNFKTECKRDVNQYKRVGKIHVVEDNIDITNDDDLVDFTIEETAYSGNTFIGNAVSKKITLNIINDGSYNLENKEIEVYVGIDYVGDGSNIEYIPYGNYIISKPTNEDVKQSSSYVGYDYMIKAETPYVGTNITYPITLYNYLSTICTAIGITLGNVSIPNGSYQVLGNAYTNGENYRQVIQEIAMCCGGFAVIGRDNKLYIKTLTITENGDLSTEDDVLVVTEDNVQIITNMMVVSDETYDEQLTPSEYFEEFKKSNIYGPVNKVAIALNENVIGEDTVMEDETSIAEIGIKEIRIAGISFLNSEAQRELVIGDVYNQLHGLSYVPFSTTYYGYPYIDSGDLVKITLPNNNFVYSYVLNHKFTYNGGFSGDIEAQALTDVENEYKMTTSAKNAIRNTELKVDKINGEIISIVGEIGNREGKTTTITQDIDHIESLVEDTLDLTDEITNTNPITLLNCRAGNLLELRIRGNNEVFKPLVPTNSLVPSATLKPLSSIVRVYSDELSDDIESNTSNYELETYRYASDLGKIYMRLKKVNTQQTNYYMEIEPFKTYVIRYKDTVVNAGTTFGIATFGSDVLDKLSDGEEQYIEANTFATNLEFTGTWWMPNGHTRDLRITAGEDDRYMFIKTYENINVYELYENYGEYDLGVTTELKKSGDYYDEYVIKENQGYELRRIGEGGVIIENPEPTNVRDLVIPLTKGTNYIDIPCYTATTYAKWIIFNELTNYFATELDLKSSIFQSSNEIKLSVMETVTDDFLARKTIESSIDLGILDDEGYIAMKTNKMSIESDHFKLTTDGRITASAGYIAGFNMWTDQVGSDTRSWLTRIINYDNKKYVSGLVARSTYNTDFLFAGAEDNGSGFSTGSAPMRLLNNGTIYCKRINLNGESGYTKINFDSGRTAVQLQYNAITFKIDNNTNDTFVQLARQTDCFYVFLQNAPAFCIYDSLHSRLSYKIQLNNGDRQTHWFRGQMYKNYADNGQDYYAILDSSSSTSDRRLKHNIEDSKTSALDVIDQMKFRQFDWNEDSPYPNVHIDIGVIAQEVKEIDDNYVIKGERIVDGKVEEMYTMNELNLVTTSMKAVQELNQKVKEQQEIIDKQEEIIQDLIERIEKLEKGDK